MTWGTVTGGPIDLYSWNSMYPYNYITNYGGQTQFNLMPSYFTPQQAYGMQNLFNPFYQISQMVGSAMNPFQNMQQMIIGQAGYNYGYQMAENIGLDALMQDSASKISSLKSQLEQALTCDKLTGIQKKQLQALKSEVEALEAKLKDLAQLRQCGATSEQVRTALNQINSEYRELRDKIAVEAEEIQKAIKDTETPKSTETSDTTEQTDIVSETLSEKIGEPSLAEFDTTGSIIAADVDDENVRTIVNEIYKKVDGLGSADIKEYLDENINKDNVVEVILHWNKHYAEKYAEDDALGLTETLMDERTFGGRKICTKILESLEARLKDYQGVNSELYNMASTKLNIARREHDAAFWTNEDKMSQAINEAHQAIVLLMIEKGKQAQ